MKAHELKAILEGIDPMTDVGIEVSTDGTYSNFAEVSRAELIKTESGHKILALYTFKFTLSDN